MKSQFTIPGAIILGCCIIAAALYLGLTGADPQADGQNSTLGIDATDPLTGQPKGGASTVNSAPAALPEPAKIIVMEQEKVDALARGALEKTRPLMLEKCWAPTIKENPEPATSVYVYNIAFQGESGKAISRSISELREKPSRGDAAQCLRMLPMDYVIDPPGKNTRVEISFTLP